MQLALGAGLFYAASEIYLGDKFPLRDPVPLPTRMLFSGGLATLCVLVAAKVLIPAPVAGHKEALG